MPSPKGVSGKKYGTVKFNATADATLNALSVGELRTGARKIAQRVRLPRRAKGLKVSTRAGIGPRGGFSQVIMRGPGALAIEFGTRRRRPVAPLRKALRGGI
jgi:hypothetical protein